MSAPAITNRRSRRSWLLRSYAYRTRLTLIMIVVTTISAIASGALDGSTPSPVVERFGYSAIGEARLLAAAFGMRGGGAEITPALARTAIG